MSESKSPYSFRKLCSSGGTRPCAYMLLLSIKSSILIESTLTFNNLVLICHERSLFVFELLLLKHKVNLLVSIKAVGKVFSWQTLNDGRPDLIIELLEPKECEGNLGAYNYAEKGILGDV